MANSRGQVTKMTCPVYIALPTSFEPSKLDPFTLAVMPSTDDMLIVRCPTLEVLGLDIFVGLTGCARRKVERTTKPMGSVDYIACRHMSLSMEARYQQPTEDEPGAADQAVERVGERSLEMVIEPVIKEMEQGMMLE